MLLLLLVELLLPSCIGAETYFQDLYKKTLFRPEAFKGLDALYRFSSTAISVVYRTRANRMNLRALIGPSTDLKV